MDRIIKIDTWEFIKGVFGIAFQVIWLIIKMIWPYLLFVIVVTILFEWIKSLIKKRKNKVGFKP